VEIIIAENVRELQRIASVIEKNVSVSVLLRSNTIQGMSNEEEIPANIHVRGLSMVKNHQSNKELLVQFKTLFGYAPEIISVSSSFSQENIVNNNTMYYVQAENDLLADCSIFLASVVGISQNDYKDKSIRQCVIDCGDNYELDYKQLLGVVSHNHDDDDDLKMTSLITTSMDDDKEEEEENSMVELPVSLNIGDWLYFHYHMPIRDEEDGTTTNTPRRYVLLNSLS